MKTNWIFFMLISLALFSCDLEMEDEHLVHNSISPFPIDTYSISEESAKNILKSFVDKNDTRSRSATFMKISKNDSIKVLINSNARSRSQSEKDTVVIYNFSLELEDSKGYGLVANDIRVPSLLTYVPEGNLSDTIYNEGLKMYINSLPNIVQYYIENFTSSISSTRAYIEGDYLPEDGGVMYFPEYDGFSQQRGDTLLYMENFREQFFFTDRLEVQVPVKWGQSSPYNNNVPITCGSSKAPAGCVAVAIAQIMAFNKYPSSYNWDLLTSKKTISSYLAEDQSARTEVARLMSDIGAKVEMSYSCNGSGSNMTKANAAFINYGYKTTGVKSYRTYWGLFDFSYAEVNFNSPIMVSGVNSSTGVGHAWVHDARVVYSSLFEWTIVGRDSSGRELSRVDLGFPGVPTSLVHINWGWNGSSDGWYHPWLSDSSTDISYKSSLQWISISK